MSVVIPAYNNGRTLGETMQSVLAQRDVDFGLIVADHSSTDGTLDVARRFLDDPRVTVLQTDAGGGASRNWNRVTDAATGSLVKLVCGDDVLLPGTLARQAAILSDTTVALTACRRNVVDANGDILMGAWGLRGLAKPMSGREAVRRSIRAGSNLFGEPASVMMRRRVLIETGGWFPDFPYLIDQATYSRVLMRGDFVPDLETGATFRMSNSQWSVALTREQSTQARRFHHWIAAAYPGLLGRSDLLIGDTRARLMAHGRRLSYKVLERRMR
ncbi:glycosyltransferase family A protein [Microbacterium sp. 18062]|uniref:glycosyltransferase family 2 protein n=1 Tax=Microbacterium sp. 18062 TaxID=2681410 RepID=UPI001F3D2EE7|nr:glycosyltransferase family A protein [Microbacterium sp. 18062]